MTAALILLLALNLPVANATYNSDCMALVTLDTQQREAFQMARAEWEQPIREAWGIKRPLSDVDFEALMDLTHGLDISVIFSNGQRTVEILKTHSMSNFQTLIRLHGVLDVEYSAESNNRVGEILAAACRLLKKRDCEVYEHYSGFDHIEERPFTLAQEQALKWATIHITPGRDIARAYGQIPAPYLFIERFNSHIMDQKQLLSLYILMSAFGDKDGSLLHVGLAQTYIETAFKNIMIAHRSGIFY